MVEVYPQEHVVAEGIDALDDEDDQHYEDRYAERKPEQCPALFFLQIILFRLMPADVR